MQEPTTPPATRPTENPGPSGATPPAWRFGVFEADLRSGELTRRGVRRRLPDKPFQVLATLLERPGQVVSREELQARLWPDSAFGDFDNNLNVAVRKLRRALGDRADSPRFVETLPRRGYRFIAPVEPVAWDGAPAAPTRPGTGRLSRRAAVWLGLGVVAALAVVAGWRLGSSEEPTAGPPARERAMLVVLPFVNLDGDPQQDFFCDGLTEEMIAQLGRLQPGRLGVIARTSSSLYKGTGKSIEEIGRELAVDYVLEGSVRSAERRARITVQLIQVSDQTHLWSETYDAELAELLTVQGEVAVEVARLLVLELLPDEPLAQARSDTRVTAAYEQYLRGRHEWNKFSAESHRRAIRHFEEAVSLDPDFAAAWAGLANAHNLLSFTADTTPAETFPAARAAAERALNLDERSAEGHAALAFVRLYFDYDLAGALRDFDRALELRPNYAMAYHWYAGVLSALERHDEAIAAMRRAVELDPLSLSVLSDAGWYFLFADRVDEAIEECRRTLDRAEYGWARACLTEAYLEAQRHGDAVAALGEGQGPLDATLEEVLRSGGPRAAVDEIRRRDLESRLADEASRRRYPVDLAFAQAAVGDLDGAFASLERAYELRDAWLVFLKVDPRFDPLRGDPRFEELRRRIGLPG